MRKPRVYRTHCLMCTEDISEITMRDSDLLRVFVSGQNKILPRRKTGSCAKHQRMISQEIKRARELGFLRYRGQQQP